MILETEHIDNLAIIYLNRPKVYNSFNREMALSLISTLRKLNESKAVRAILITGKGKAFCAGQDLSEAVGENDITVEKAVAEHYNPIIKLIRNIEKPVIAAVNGVAAGAGANIALACDIVVASSSASFIQAFSKIGLIPDSGGTFFLPRLIGFQKASALMMLGDKVGANEAEKMGLIYKVYNEEIFKDEAEKLALKLSEMPTQGLAYTKHLLNQSMVNNLDQQLDQEKIFQALAANTYDSKEGIEAFIEKRKPEFKGK